jgi:hypothetical protein
MFKLSHKLFLTTLAIGFIPLVLPSQWVFSLKSAQATQLYKGKIEFYGSDEATLVGTGTFSFDTDDLTFVEEVPVPDPEPSDGFYVNTALSSFSANVIEHHWSLGSKAWWLDGSIKPGYQAVSRYGIYITPKTWFFGDPYFGEEALVMYFNSFSENDGSGTWHAEVGFLSMEGHGTWKATVKPVPEPLTILGTGAALGFGALFKRKLALKNQV